MTLGGVEFTDYSKVYKYNHNEILLFGRYTRI